MNKLIAFLILLFPLLFIQCNQNPLQIQPQVTHLTDFESNDGIIQLNLTGGKPPYDIQWSNYKTDTLITGLKAGVYFVTITDARQTIIIDTIEVTQPQWPICIDAQGYNYKTTLVGDYIWMIENLRSTVNAFGDTIPSLVYDKNEEIATTYGRLYTWSAVMAGETTEGSQGICPDGWHIPTDTEWTYLIDNLSTPDKDIPNIKSELNLNYAGFHNNGFYGIDQSISFWTSTEAADNAWKVYFNASLSKAFRYHEKKTNAISVRCIKPLEK